MTSQIVAGLLKTNIGYIPVESTITDSADNAEIQTDATFTVTSQSIGTYADGQILQSATLSAKTQILYAYVLRNGVNVCNIPGLTSRANMSQPRGLQQVTNQIRFSPGDQLVCRCEV